MKIEREVISVRLQNASLDDKGDGTIVAHGWLDLSAILELRVGDYQREILESTGRTKSKILTAIENGDRIPDIMLGMRGERFTTRGKTFELEDDVYIIDGLQRVSNLRRFATQNPEKASTVRIGAEVRFNTDRESEKKLFTVLNLNRTAMSPNVILRNARDESNGLLTLYGLSHNDPSFALYNRVSWNQKMNRYELITAMNYCRTVMALHRGLGSTAPPTNVAAIPLALARSAEELGVQVIRDNAYRFFEVMDEVWGIKGIKYVDITTHLRGNFMNSLARLFANHENFWDAKRLIVDAKARQKLKSFPLDDPTIQKMCSTAGGAGADLIYRLLTDHMDKGQKINRLIPRVMPDVRALASKHRTKRDGLGNLAKGLAQKKAS